MIEKVVVHLRQMPDDITHNSLYNLLQQHIAEIQSLLDAYYFTKRGKVHNTLVDETSVSLQGIAGSFKTTFKVNYTNGCQDVSYDETESMVMRFTLDSVAKVLYLAGEEWYERAPDEF